MDILKTAKTGVGYVLLSLLVVALMLTVGQKVLLRQRDVPHPQRVRLVFRENNRTCKEQVEDRDKAMAGLMNKSITPDNPQLIGVIRNNFIDPLSTHVRKMSLPLFKTPQADAIDKILHKKQNGFFVECGALDGERSSNSIFFEQKRGWRGLLVEMDPSWYMQLRGKNRKAYSINACISSYQYPTQMKFKEHDMGQGKLVEERFSSDSMYSVYCLPFYSMMLALNHSRIDYFSLDVEGSELDILKTIPFDKLDIETLSVEYAHAKDGQKYIDFMEKKGYDLHSVIEAYKPEIYFGCKDFIFVKQRGL